jgi:heme exporter protein B
MSAILALIRRETMLTWRQGGAGFLALGFFLLAAGMFPFAVGVAPSLLSAIGGGVIWVAALLAALLTLDRLFALDYEDGSLDLLLTAPVSPAAVALAKAVSHWLNTMLPLILAAPLAGLLFDAPGDAIKTLMVSLLLGTPALSFIGAIASALTASVKRGGVLIPLLALPFFVPTLIFGAGALSGGPQAAASLYYLGALSAFWVAVGPIAAAAALTATADG